MNELILPEIRNTFCMCGCKVAMKHFQYVDTQEHYWKGKCNGCKRTWKLDQYEN